MERVGVFGSDTCAHGGHAFPDGTFLHVANDSTGRLRPVVEMSATRVKAKTAGAHFAASKMTRDMACLNVAVMLHLRACYVSKAAILTVPVSLVPVENRSPA
jgi:hypothetical protein